MTPREPNLSLNLPMAIPTIPFIIHKREKAPAVRAFVHPKSLSIGLKKTPKAVFAPMAPRKMRNAAVTTRLSGRSDNEVLRCAAMSDLSCERGRRSVLRNQLTSVNRPRDQHPDYSTNDHKQNEVPALKPRTVRTTRGRLQVYGVLKMTGCKKQENLLS